MSLQEAGQAAASRSTEVGATSLVGTTARMLGVGSSDGWGSPIEIPYSDIAQIDLCKRE